MRTKIKLLKANDLTQLENLINDCIETQAKESFFFQNVDIVIAENFYIATLVFKFSNVRYRLSSSRTVFEFKTLYEQNLNKLEKSCNSLIKEMQNENFFLSTVQLKKDFGKKFIAVMSFQYANSFYRVN